MISRRGSIICIALLTATFCFTTSVKHRIENTPTPQLSELPTELKDWHGVESGEVDLAARATLKLDQFLRRTYTKTDGSAVHLYIGYWHRQTGDHQAAKHSPALCLPANGWVIHKSNKVSLASLQHSPVANTLIAERSTKKFLFVYWFFSGDEIYSEEWLTLIKVSFGILAGKRPDGGIVEISIPLDSTASDALTPGLETAREFAELIAPEISHLMQGNNNNTELPLRKGDGYSGSFKKG